MTLESANFWNTASNWAAIIGALLVFLGTMGIFKTQAIRDFYADLRAEEHERVTQVAKRDAATANEKTAELQKEAAELQLKLEEERTQRLKIEAGLASRHLSAHEIEALKAAFAPYSGRSIHLIAVSDAEAEEYGQELAEVLEAAGLHVKYEPGSNLKPAAIGLVAHFNHATSAEREMVDALIQAGLTITIGRDRPPGVPLLRVGLKPKAF